MNMEKREESIKLLDSIVPFENYIKHLITLLKYLRIWRQRNTFSVSKLFVLTITIALSLFANFVLIISELLMVSGNSDIEQLSNTINPLGLHMTGFIKWIYCINKSKEISRLVADLNRCYLLSKRIEISKRGCDFSKTEMETVYKNSRIWQYLWTTFCVYGIIHWCFNALIQKYYGQVKILNTSDNNVDIDYNSLPYITWQPWSIGTVKGYGYSFIIQLIGALTSTVGAACYDSLHICILMIICGQFRCLYFSLIEIDTIVGVRTIEELEMKLRYCVDHHIAVLKISKDLENFGNLPMFVQCLENIIIICLLSFEMTVIEFKMDSESITKLLSLMEYFSALSVQLYIFCFYSTQIYSLSLQIADAVYACNWEMIIYDKIENTKKDKQLTMKVKHLILFLSLRAQKPIVMTGGPFYVLSLETFKSVNKFNHN
ncbi:odorant receptor 13a-like [Vespa mandarinia]|uniref:odorant receptor 13a-like n=1 Tax=Vespa mandarinia TaxID=7446 RepID=UPI001614E525|nr:odorant receptor 13a-like [Vespa mandarinia]